MVRPPTYRCPVFVDIPPGQALICFFLFFFFGKATVLFLLVENLRVIDLSDFRAPPKWVSLEYLVPEARCKIEVHSR